MTAPETPFIAEAATVTEKAYAETILGFPKGDIVTMTTAPHGSLFLILADGSKWMVDRLGGRRRAEWRDQW